MQGSFDEKCRALLTVCRALSRLNTILKTPYIQPMALLMIKGALIKARRFCWALLTVCRAHYRLNTILKTPYIQYNPWLF